MRFGSSYRDLQRFVLCRVNRVAGEINTVLIVVAIGLAMLDLLYVVQHIVDSLPPTVGTGTLKP